RSRLPNPPRPPCPELVASGPCSRRLRGCRGVERPCPEPDGRSLARLDPVVVCPWVETPFGWVAAVGGAPVAEPPASAFLRPPPCPRPRPPPGVASGGTAWFS